VTTTVLIDRKGGGDVMTRAVLFDIGHTLVRYYQISEFPPILEKCLQSAATSLREDGWHGWDESEFAARVAAEDHEAPDFCVRPLRDRLARIFEVDESGQPDLLTRACRSFMDPIFEIGVVYDDTIPCLTTLREMGYKTAIVSNTPWGSPADLWRDEIRRLGLAGYVDAVVCCGDVGWRKPAAPIFQRAMDELGVTVGECVFVGDDPRWDIVGPRAIGMEAVLIDRTGPKRDDSATIGSLDQLLQHPGMRFR
jgi:putative hydrolase of the HAD superfamily